MIGTLEDIFNYEAVEDAWKAILTRCGLLCYLEFCDDDKDASQKPYVEVTLNNVVPNGQLYPFKGEQLPRAWNANLTSRVVTFRGINSDKQRMMVGRIRLEIQRYQTNFIASVLPFHQVVDMRESSLTRGVNEMTDWSEIQSDIVFYVRDDVWPDSQ